MWGATGDHGSDFNLIAFVQHLVFGDEIIAFDYQMRFDDEIQLAQEFLNFLGAFDLDGSGWMAQLDLHGRILSFHACRGQGVSPAGCEKSLPAQEDRYLAGLVCLVFLVERNQPNRPEKPDGLDRPG